MKRTVFAKYIIILSLVFISSYSINAQWSDQGSYQYTLDRIDIGQNLGNSDRELNIYGSETYGYQVGAYSFLDFSSSTNGFAGKAISRISDCSSWSANGMGIGITAYAYDVTQIRNTNPTKTSYVGGGSFGVNITDPIPSYRTSTGTYLIFGVRAYINGSITNYPSDGVVTALYARDYIKGAKTWAGYFDGNLAVTDTITANNIEVVSTVPWPDYVFQKDYKLKDIGQLESYILNNKRLPGIPSSEEVKSNGINLEEMNVKLLEKVEELTLYVIRLNNEIKTIKAEQGKE